jgi:hypothetical protein
MADAQMEAIPPSRTADINHRLFDLNQKIAKRIIVRIQTVFNLKINYIFVSATISHMPAFQPGISL